MKKLIAFLIINILPLNCHLQIDVLESNPIKGQVKYLYEEWTSYYYPNDSSVSFHEYKYNENNKLTSELNGTFNDEKNIFGNCYQFDNGGEKIISQYFVNNGDTSGIINYDYDETNRIIESRLNPSTISKYVYEKDKLIEISTFINGRLERVKRLEYNKFDSITKEYDLDYEYSIYKGKLIQEIDSTYKFKGYDSKGLKIYERFSSNNSVYEKKWIYDDLNRVFEERSEVFICPQTVVMIMGEDGVFHEKELSEDEKCKDEKYIINYFYNSQNQIVFEVKRNLKNNIVSNFLHIYNENGDVISSIFINVKTGEKSYTTYKYVYDKNRNWIERKTYWDKLELSIRRKIEYY
jgi:hypothetical protein